MTGELKGNKGYILYTCLFLVMCIAAFYPFFDRREKFYLGSRSGRWIKPAFCRYYRIMGNGSGKLLGIFSMGILKSRCGI